MIGSGSSEKTMRMKKTVKTDFSIDDLKALKIAGRLFNEFYSRKGFFANYPMPEYVLPRNVKEASKEHVCSSRLETRISKR